MGPNLYILGFQKCGSSTLFDLLAQHPNITPCFPKETFFLSDKTFEHYHFERSIHNQEASWSQFYPENKLTRYSLEGSVCNFYQETAIQYIRGIGDARAIFILRDPVDRFISNYKYYSGNGIFLPPRTTISDYFELLQKGEAEKEAMRYALKHGQYSQYIDKWIKALGADRVLVLGFKPFIADPKSTIEEVCAFLDIDILADFRMNHKNQSKSLRFPLLNKLLVKYLGNRGLGKGTIKKFYRLINRKPAKVDMPDELRHKLKQFYQLEYKEWGHLF